MRTRRFDPATGARTVLAAAIALAFALPLIWLVASAFRPSTATFATAGEISWRTLWPTPFTLDNFQAALDAGFLRNVANSVIVAGATVVVGLAICALAAYALSAIEFRGREIVFTVVVVSFLVPFEAIAIPLSGTFRDIGLANSLFGLVLPGLANGLAVFSLRQFFLGIPRELREAAELDGAGHLRTFLMVYLPLSRPALIGSGLILFLFQWQAYLWPVLVTADPSQDVAAVAIARNFSGIRADFGATFAETLIIALLPAVVLLALQRFFIASLAASGGKE